MLIGPSNCWDINRNEVLENVARVYCVYCIGKLRIFAVFIVEVLILLNYRFNTIKNLVHFKGPTQYFNTSRGQIIF